MITVSAVDVELKLENDVTGDIDYLTIPIRVAVRGDLIILTSVSGSIQANYTDFSVAAGDAEATAEAIIALIPEIGGSVGGGVTTNQDLVVDARTISGNTAAQEITTFASAAYTITVSAASGTLDLWLEESTDGGATWVKVYCETTVTGTTVLNTPRMTLTGTHYRWGWTMTGAGFTFGIKSVRYPTNGVLCRRFIDRTLNIQLLNATTAVWETGGISQFTIGIFTVGIGGNSQIITEFSADGVNWLPLIGAIVASGTVTGSMSTPVHAKLIRCRVAVAGGITQFLTYLILEGRR